MARLPDLGLMGTATVTVTRREQTGTDPFNAPVYDDVDEQVPGVLPQPGATDDLSAERPDGVTVDMTFHFPRGYSKSLRGCRISYGGVSYEVVGDPQPYLPEITPGPFSTTVEAVRVDG